MSLFPFAALMFYIALCTVAIILTTHLSITEAKDEIIKAIKEKDEE